VSIEKVAMYKSAPVNHEGKFLI